MKKNRTFLSLLFAAVLLFSGAPSVACGSTCAPAHSSMECARRCSMGAEHGMHAAKGAVSLRSNCCGTASDEQVSPAALVSESQVKVATDAPQGLIAYTTPDLSPEFKVAIIGTAVPPVPSPYLWSQHPFANAPPSFV